MCQWGDLGIPRQMQEGLSSRLQEISTIMANKSPIVGMADKFLWNEDQEAGYSVKSGYDLILEGKNLEEP